MAVNGSINNNVSRAARKISSFRGRNSLFTKSTTSARGGSVKRQSGKLRGSISGG